MTRLSSVEISCLRRIADEPSAASPPCPDNVLNRLLSLDLVACEPKLWAPLEAVDMRYHLTASGRELLLRLDDGSEPNDGQAEQ